MAHRIAVVRARALHRVLAMTLLLASVLAVDASAASADPPVAVSLDSVTSITRVNDDGSVNAEGTFTAAGPGAAVLCPAGAVADTFVSVSDDAGPRVVRATETYTCGDGSGSFQLKFRGRRTSIDGSLVTFTAKVVVTEGTGAYTGLRAEGTGIAVLDTSAATVENAYELDIHRS